MRIVTRPDFDGIVCAVLLYDALQIDEPVKWVEPNDLQKGRVNIRKQDVIANLPYDENCALWFDHHYTNRINTSFKGAFKIAPSAAGIIFEHYKGRFKRDYSELVQAADKIDSADLSLDEALHPEKYAYVMLSMTVSNGGEPDEAYWNMLVELLREFDIQQVLENPQVYEHCQSMLVQDEIYIAYLKENTELIKHLSITDFRPFTKPPAGNRFLVYSLFPDTYVNMRIRYEDRNDDRVAVQVGHSIFNPKCNVNVGLMLTKFEGGGHRGAGSTRFQASKADAYIPKIIDILLKNENNEK
jgi:oligoribonuclease NrnB/cAMP/cGMP phosphodiesterase (DHH superfamily)